MSAQQELISAVRSMQANAQANLPVIPNNGNPNGAYNAPRAAQGVMLERQGPQHYSWLEPSPAMQQLRDSMTQRQQYLDSALRQIRQPAQPMDTPMSVPQQPQPQPQQLPMTPALPPMPVTNLPPVRNRGVVLPSTGMNTGVVPPTMPNTGVNVPLPRTM